MLRGIILAARVCVWLVLLVAVAWPWRSLGGLVDERLRWMESLVLWTAPAFGLAAGRSAAVGWRWLYYPPLAMAALASAVLRLAGPADAIGIVTTAWLGYTAGADIGWTTAPGSTAGTREVRDPDPAGPPPWLAPWDRP